MTSLTLLAVIAALLPGPHHEPGACHLNAGKADTACTPGATNPDVTQATINSTICRPGWTATVRPPASYTNTIKRRQMIEYGLTGPPAAVEEDHLIPLVLGGSPRDPRNLYPQPRVGPGDAATKDREEVALGRAVCGGRITLADAQQKITQDWTHTAGDQR